jgi:hypothetical protein
MPGRPHGAALRSVTAGATPNHRGGIQINRIDDLMPWQVNVATAVQPPRCLSRAYWARYFPIGGNIQVVLLEPDT